MHIGWEGYNRTLSNEHIFTSHLLGEVIQMVVRL